MALGNSGNVVGSARRNSLVAALDNAADAVRLARQHAAHPEDHHSPTPDILAALGALGAAEGLASPAPARDVTGPFADR